MDAWRFRDPDFRQRLDQARDQSAPAPPPVAGERPPVQLPSRDQLLGLLVREAINGRGGGSAVRAIEILLKETRPEPPPSRLAGLVEKLWQQP